MAGDDNTSTANAGGDHQGTNWVGTISERDIIVYKAKLAEQAERYDEMAESMRELVKKVNEPLTVEERNLLSVAYKNSVGARRASLRIISTLEQKHRKNDQKEYVQITEQHRNKVGAELIEICNSIISLLDDHLLQSVEDHTEAKVFYLKMKGDYYRYLCEFSEEDQKNGLAEKAKDAYNKASDLAAQLTATHPVRLGLALNFSVFYYEILGKPELACGIAKQAFDHAITELDSTSDESYRDSTLIMQLLRDNLTLWTEAPEPPIGPQEPQADEK